MSKTWEGCYTRDELLSLGLRHVGNNVLISKESKIYNPTKLSVGNNVRIDDFSILTGDIELGSYVHIGAYCLLSGKHGRIKFKDFTTLAARVSIYTGTDDYTRGTSLSYPNLPSSFLKVIEGNVILDEHVIIGAGSVILPSSHLMEGAAVGALSLIKSGVYEKWYFYAGIPAIKKKKRPSEIILGDARRLLQMNDQ